MTLERSMECNDNPHLPAQSYLESQISSRLLLREESLDCSIGFLMLGCAGFFSNISFHIIIIIYML
jgi:hypothetical protein